MNDKNRNKDISDILAGLRAEFVAALPERLEGIESHVLALPQGGEYEELVREVHSLKGTAGSISHCQILTTISHHMEDCMAKMIAGNCLQSPTSLRRLLKYVDLLKQAVTLIRQQQVNFEQVEKQLLDIIEVDVDKQIRVMLIEPSPLYMEIEKNSLCDEHIELVTEADGYTALGKLLMQKVDVVIVALENPTLNGDTVIAAVKSTHCINKNVKTVLITSRDKNEVNNINLFDHIVERKDMKNNNIVGVVRNLIYR